MTPARPGSRGRRMQRHRLRLRMTTSRGSSFTVNVSSGGACTEQLRVLAVGTRIEGPSPWTAGTLLLRTVAWTRQATPG